MFVYSLEPSKGHALLAMIAKRSYRFSRGSCQAEPTTPAVTEVPRYTPSASADAFERLVEDTDLFAPLKPSTDVLLSGSAHAVRGPVRMLDTAVVVGPLRKNVRAWGRRTVCRDRVGRPGFSDPEPFTSLPLVWDHAYGGRDTQAERALGSTTRRAFARPAEPDAGAIVYPRNPAGHGFRVSLDAERIVGTEVPRLEDPEDPVTADRLLAKSERDWMDRPAAASYGPVDWIAFPRAAFWLGTEGDAPTRPVYEARRGLLRPEDLSVRPPGTAADPRAYNCAPAGLSGARLRGHERVGLWNLHPRHEALEFQLPGERPTMLLEPPGCGAYELPAMLQTVLIEPDEDRVTLTWTGTLEVAAPFPEEMCETMRKAVRWDR